MSDSFIDIFNASTGTDIFIQVSPSSEPSGIDPENGITTFATFMVYNDADYIEIGPNGCIPFLSVSFGGILEVVPVLKNLTSNSNQFYPSISIGALPRN